LPFSSRIREHIRHNLWGIVAVFIALGGTATALPGKNSVDSGDIKRANVKRGDLANGAVTNPKLAPNAVDGSKVADDSLKGADVDEGSLEIPQQALPTSLPPSGAAGGDLSGSYPDPQVQESGLAAGGDLAGSTLSNAQIGAETVGAAEIANDFDSTVIPASEVGPTATDGAGEPDIGENSGYPALLFDQNVDEDANLIVRVPDDYTGSGCLIDYLWSAPATGNVSWQMKMTELTPNDGETLPGTFFLDSGSTDGSPVPGNVLVRTSFPCFATAPSPGDLIRLEVGRNGLTQPSDNLPDDAALHLVDVRWPTTR
jgi:hypothetical protein